MGDRVITPLAVLAAGRLVRKRTEVGGETSAAIYQSEHSPKRRQKSTVESQSHGIGSNGGEHVDKGCTPEPACSKACVLSGEVTPGGDAASGLLSSSL